MCLTEKATQALPQKFFAFDKINVYKRKRMEQRDGSVYSQNSLIMRSLAIPMVAEAANFITQTVVAASGDQQRDKHDNQMRRVRYRSEIGVLVDKHQRCYNHGEAHQDGGRADEKPESQKQTASSFGKRRHKAQNALAK